MSNFLRNALLVPALCWVGGAAGAQEPVYEDEQVKAAFLYHFATFVEWPQTAQPDQHFTIAVLGADDIAAELEGVLPGRTIQGRPMSVQRLQSIDDLADAAVLFIGGERNADLPRLIDDVADRPLLVVTDSPGALRDGAMINFQVVDRRVRFEISLPAAERAGLQLSSRLLSAAMFVDTTGAVVAPPRAVFATAERTALTR